MRAMTYPRMPSKPHPVRNRADARHCSAGTRGRLVRDHNRRAPHPPRRSPFLPSKDATFQLAPESL
jgi:hypothetical protein